MPKASNPRRKKAAKRAKSPAPGGGYANPPAPLAPPVVLMRASPMPSVSALSSHTVTFISLFTATGSAIMGPPAAASVVASEDAGAPTTDTGDKSEEEDEDPAADLLQHLNNVAASTGIPMLNTPLPVTTIVAALGQLNPNVFQNSALAQQITNPQPPAGTPSPVGPPAPTAVPIHLQPQL
ncbi:hypothetical protein NLJ89_g11258 [Agrocybe chaxingu]|uniref:Uncharacterized protein n=1 Tax=Agrocybe chaxingu TaxID=84603 RepID=A0A9W8MRB6_9AGAR|nr:hypothetical protein NLJ89_g11258 [Agrocybe chaxingu]